MNLNALPRGKDRAKSIGSLAEALNVSHRQMEQDLLALALSHVPIVACDRGVYVTDDPAEMLAYADRLEDRLRSQLERIRAARETAKRMDVKQGTMPWAA